MRCSVRRIWRSSCGRDVPGILHAGFQLGMGIAGEIEPYCFEDEEEKRATERAKNEVPSVQKLDTLYKEKGLPRRQLFLIF